MGIAETPPATPTGGRRTRGLDWGQPGEMEGLFLGSSGFFFSFGFPVHRENSLVVGSDWTGPSRLNIWPTEAFTPARFVLTLRRPE